MGHGLDFSRLECSAILNTGSCLNRENNIKHVTCINTYVNCSSGALNGVPQILLDGMQSEEDTVKRKLAYVIQHDRLLPNLTVLETLTFVARLTYPRHNQKKLDAKVGYEVY